MSTITASSSVHFTSLLAAMVPGCGPCGMHRADDQLINLDHIRGSNVNEHVGTLHFVPSYRESGAA